jgi:lipoprotein-releasing system ATP-binding protein
MEIKEKRGHPILQAKNLYKHFQNPKFVSILKGIDLDVYRGETIAITGRSGEGKSTLLQVLGTLEPPTSGSLEIDGKSSSAFNKI